MATFTKPATRDGFSIAIICGLVEARDSVMEMLDEEWAATEYEKAHGDMNTYRVGRIGPHCVVVALLAGMGPEQAASAAANLRSSFDRIALGLVVGVCGGVPTKTNSGDILLGDIILSEQVVNFTFNRQYDHATKIKDTDADRLGRPNRDIRSLLRTLQGQRDRKRLKKETSKYIIEFCKKDEFVSWGFPGIDKDVVYPRSYRHKHQLPGSCPSCKRCIEAENRLNEAEASGKSDDEIKKAAHDVQYAEVCDESQIMLCEELNCDSNRAMQRDSNGRGLILIEGIEGLKMRAPEIHFGVIGSGSSVMKSGYIRDRLAEERKIIAFEMEGAGVWENFPTVVIKAVCDYADSHERKEWQKYASCCAAACMKAFLMEWTAVDAPCRQDVAGTVNQRHYILLPFLENKRFVGRTAILETLENKLYVEKNCLQVAVFGPGGIGKTQVALQFAYRVKKNKPDYSIFWVPALSHACFAKSYAEIAGELGIEKGNDNDDLNDLVRRYLCSGKAGKWILIVDNADDTSLILGQPGNPGIIRYLPESEHGRVVFTTRSREVAFAVAVSNIINLKEMTQEEGINFLDNSLTRKELLQDKATTVKLLEELAYLPLAITQAAAYLNRNQLSIPNYLGLLNGTEENFVSLFSREFHDPTRYAESRNAIATTWLLQKRVLSLGWNQSGQIKR
ncbi:nucleoside phosphorylase domain-containing protein [Xylariales sp. PMI_506]|nr:nucleoside phosphorylase domain-containing protein [Xylariales sp. PMI_506]